VHDDVVADAGAFRVEAVEQPQRAMVAVVGDGGVGAAGIAEV
jgi:hypothetical protein